MSYASTSYGKNHKDEKILKIHSKNCPFCNSYMKYFEFRFHIDIFEESNDNNVEMQKLAAIQQFEDLLKKTENGEKISLEGLIIGCGKCYLNTSKADMAKREKKPYIILEAEDVYKFGQMPVSHIYLAEPI